MYRKHIGKSAFLFLIIVVMLLGVGCKAEPIPTLAPEAKQVKQPMNATPLERQAKFVEDITDLIETVEATHPAFVLDDLPANYEKEKMAILEEVKKGTNRIDFEFLVRRYLTLLRDGHTKVQSTGSNMAIDIECAYVDGVLLALDEAVAVTQKKITHIGSVPIQQIMNMCDLYFPAENDAARARNYSQNALNAQILQYAGCKIDGDTVQITFEIQGNLIHEYYSITTKEPFLSHDYTTEISSQLFGDVLYIDMNVCIDNKALEDQIGIIKSTVKKGIKKVIIDVRNNGGGDSMASEKLIMALDMVPPSLGANVRYSELAKVNCSEYPNDGYETYEPDLTVAKQNKEIKLDVLTNVYTFSAATDLGSMVQDGVLGIIIGTPSSNAPTSYGNCLLYTLPNNNIDVSISYKRFIRADKNANQNTLVPDLVTGFGVDSLEVALDYLGKKK